MNPFRILIIMATVIAIAFAAGFVYIVFAQHPGHVERNLGTSSVIDAL